MQNTEIQGSAGTQIGCRDQPLQLKNFPSFISYSIPRAGNTSPIPVASPSKGLAFQRLSQGSGLNQFPGSNTPLAGLMVSLAQKNPDLAYFHSHLLQFIFSVCSSPRSALERQIFPQSFLFISLLCFFREQCSPLASSPLQSLTNGRPHLHETHLSLVFVSRKINKKNSQNQKPLISYPYFSFYKNPFLSLKS